MAYHGKKKTPRQPDDGTTIRAPWQQVEFHESDGRAAVDGVMQLRADMDRQWGVGRLRLVVSQVLREKFDRQEKRLIDALEHADIGTLKAECARMTTAYTALNRAAMEAGVEELQPEVWEVALGDGSIAALVRTTADAFRVLADGRQKNVYTLNEIANLIGGFPALAKIKETFPGARVHNVKLGVKPLAAGGDDIPDLTA